MVHTCQQAIAKDTHLSYDRLHCCVVAGEYVVQGSSVEEVREWVAAIRRECRCVTVVVAVVNVLLCPHVCVGCSTAKSSTEMMHKSAGGVAAFARRTSTRRARCGLSVDGVLANVFAIVGDCNGR